MSYEIIKSIKVKNNKVFVTGASNNVRPQTFTEWECYPLSKVLQDKGKEALDVEILKAYEEGNFQRGNNRYTRALEVLRHMPIYHKKYDWGEDNKKNRESFEFEKLLKKALHTYLPKDKFVITKEMYNGQKVYGKKVRCYMKWCSKINKGATIYRYREDAEFVKKWFTNSGSWKVDEIK